ncbi:MAG: hypothetical protein ACRD82_01555 [Blastocatellia bacterium]
MGGFLPQALNRGYSFGNKNEIADKHLRQRKKPGKKIASSEGIIHEITI